MKAERRSSDSNDYALQSCTAAAAVLYSHQTHTLWQTTQQALNN
jgi:hypothetical protein